MAMACISIRYRGNTMGLTLKQMLFIAEYLIDSMPPEMSQDNVLHELAILAMSNEDNYRRKGGWPVTWSLTAISLCYIG